MSDIRTSFYYDPIRQGYDTNSWKTLSGAPAVVAGGRLSVDNGSDAGSAVHYADFLKGDISFNVNSSAPGANTGHVFGVSAPNTSAYIRFSIAGTLTCQTSDGTTTSESAEIPWNTNWSGANIEFRIRWEAGTAKFFIAGSQVYAISNSSVPAGPLSLYLSDDSSSAMTIGDIAVRGTQSFVMNPKTSDTTSFSGLLMTSSSVTVTDVIAALKIPTLIIPWDTTTLFDSITVSENVNIVNVLRPNVFDSVTITENFAGVKI